MNAASDPSPSPASSSSGIDGGRRRWKGCLVLLELGAPPEGEFVGDINDDQTYGNAAEVISWFSQRAQAPLAVRPSPQRPLRPADALTQRALITLNLGLGRPPRERGSTFS